MTTAMSPNQHARRYGVAALLIALPTTVLVALSLLKYVAGIAGPFDAVAPTITPLVTHPLGETIVILAPYLAFGLAAFPVTRLRAGRADGRVHMAVAVTSPILNLVAALLSGAAIVVMLVYYLMENF